MNQLHVAINLRLNTEHYGWRDPAAEFSLSFDVPVELFDSGKLKTVIDKKLKEMEPELERLLAEKAVEDARKEAEGE